MPTLDDFASKSLQQALAALRKETTRGVDMEQARHGSHIKDIEGRKMANDSFMNSARAAGVQVLALPLSSWSSTIRPHMEHQIVVQHECPNSELIETSLVQGN